MKRRDFHGVALGLGLAPILAKTAAAQMSAPDTKPAVSAASLSNIHIKRSPRVYNQVNVPRKYSAGQRRFSIYWTWSYPWEANRDVTQMDNRFSTMTDWPRLFCSLAPTSRATMSPVPPGAKLTIRWMGRLG